MAATSVIRDRLFRSLLVLLALSLSNCGGGGGDGNGNTTGFSATLTESSYSIPGATEGYKCNGSIAAKDTFIVGFRASLPPEVVRVTINVDSTAGQLNDFDCSASLTSSQLIYAGGSGTNDYSFPAGKGVVIRAGQYILLTAQINNTSASPVTNTAKILMNTGNASTVTTPVEMIYVGTFNTSNIPLPSDGAPHTFNGNCAVANPQNFLALAPHMNALGTHISFTNTRGVTTTTLLDQAYDVLHQPIAALNPEFSVVNGDHVNAGCTYVNNTGSSVTFGESVHQEQCLVGVYRYPVTTSSAPFSCVMGAPL